MAENRMLTIPPYLEGLGIEGCLNKTIIGLYCSDAYKRLSDETAKLWHYVSVALYQEFMDELKQKGNESGD